jgi:sarcosine oxidase delta subunit
MSWAEHIARFGRREKHLSFDGRVRRKNPLERHRHRWEDNIKMDPREKGLSGKDYTHVAKGRDQFRVLVNTVTNFVVP